MEIPGVSDRVTASRLVRLCGLLLKQLESAARARVLATEVEALFPDSAVVVYMADEAAQAWQVKATVGGLTISRGAIAYEAAGSLGAVLEEHAVMQFAAGDLAREEFAHLDLRRSFSALSYVPILLNDRLLGCIEIVSFGEAATEEALDEAAEMAEHAAVALDAALRYEAERGAGLASVLRLTQLYDIERVFNATLEMRELLPIICSKVQDLMGADAVNLWLVDQSDLLLTEQVGEEGTALGERRADGEGVVGGVGETGEEALVQEDERSVIAAPLLHAEALTGVLEVVQFGAQRQFTEDHLFTLTQVAGSAAQALHNSSLLQAERKIEVLRTLVGVGQEITSTLNLQRVLEAIVNQPQLVIPYERAAIALEQRGRIAVRAISGVTKLDTSTAEVQALNGLLSWVAGLGTEVYVTQREEEISDARPETREKFRRYFETSGMRSFYALPLGDDEGRLGILSFESPDAEFLGALHLEIIKILSSQATLALRNASLYKEVPFIGILEPLIEKRRRFMAIERRRRGLLLGSVAMVALALVLVPLPMRVSGQAQVSPSQTQYVHAEEDSVVQRAFVREGDRVEPGTPLFQMADWGQRATLAGAQAKYETAMAQRNRSLTDNDATAAGQHEVEVEYARGEVTRLNDRLERTTLRSEIAGVVATPHVEDLVGKKLSNGDPVVELVSTASVVVDVAVLERDVALVRPGAEAVVKLESFPTVTFRGRVDVVSPSGTTVGDKHLFFARVELPNADGRLRPGMQGTGKVRVGLRPLGYVLFRDPALWVWSTLWNWFAW
ncbi:efflux RND transporter periplasmic adaptor subunit [Tunturiibacter gelidoferens]|uniref:GAF domain-containing protein/biotin carboxyl carrier protein n=1 Tax=Tunturiibacter gelidiferens TaxID=3069689 RepID=A0ACC5P3Z4_9BACT|nr:efflux RND transporter periplasmic adaptor subunit [Edaphobacter lichenicola]MBB5341515.1 GAF domain-containing protein/biotin carboxyl carrier protein [Edaphobacter lichenicola]